MTLTIPAKLNGREVKLVLDDTALQRITDGLAQPRKRVPLVGFNSLREALAKVGIKRDRKTLERWAGKNIIPRVRFKGRSVFHLDDVLHSIGGA